MLAEQRVLPCGGSYSSESSPPRSSGLDANTQVLVSQWFLTLFTYSLRPPMLLRVLDLTFTDGWKAMFRFGLARLRSVEVGAYCTSLDYVFLSNRFYLIKKP